MNTFIQLISRHRFIAIAAIALIGITTFIFVATRSQHLEAVVSEPRIDIQVSAIGTVESRSLAEIGFGINGRIQSVFVDHGDTVKTGDLLAELDDGEQRARLEQAQARTHQAEAEVARAVATEMKARLVLEESTRIDTRKQKLVVSGTVSRESAEASSTARKVATTDLKQAQIAVNAARAGMELAQASERYEQAVLERHRLRAPFAALVISRTAEPGSIAISTKSQFTLIDPGTRWVRAYLDESLAGHLELGQSAEIRLRSRPSDIFHGRVARIGLENDRVSEERQFFIAFNDIPDGLVLGEQAEVVVTTQSLSDVIAVPARALMMTAANEALVWTIDEGALKRHAVTVGNKMLDGRRPIVAGLSKDAIVVVQTASNLREGDAAIPLYGNEK
ncbi:MAG: efflux RND transporter periplasmic adaptor subunit [Rhodospirillaceae bacterium]|nr:efflux RND transporter periplasmic adaptor subunit [Rhodospirillaceae bacterium]